MADFPAEVVALSLTPLSAGLDSVTGEVFPFLTSIPVPPVLTYYKLRASCSSSPSGFIDWINTTGDNTGQPGCGGTLGPTQIVATWTA